MSETIAEFIDAAWNDHVADPRGVAARLPAARPLLERDPAQVGAFLQLAEHLLLGHLGDADAIRSWLDWAEPLVAQHPDAVPALARARLAARLLRGDVPNPGEQPAAMQVRALGTAINGLAARGDIARARRLLDTAATRARAPGAGADALKALAASYNNLASQLLDGARSPQADALMLEAAQASRDTWAEAGTWLNVERGDYGLALCAAAVGDGATSVGHARACLSICAANDADAFERFFGHEALARGLLARGERAAAASELPTMHTLLAAIDDDGNRAYAQSCLDKLQGLVNPA
jgi:hypothetical protein